MIPIPSAGDRASKALRACPQGRILAVHRVACHLLADSGEIIILATPEAGAGPLNLVAPAAAWSALGRGAPFTFAGGQLTLGPLRFDLAHAATWESQPDWVALAARRENIHSGVRAIERCLRVEAEWRLQPVSPQQTMESRLQPVCHISRLRAKPAKASTPECLNGPAVAVAVSAVMMAYARGDWAGLERAIRGLCGLGPGLTPAGDDWLAGWLLGLRLAAPGEAIRCGRLVAEAARGRTTALSRAYLACAAAGETDAAWRALLDGLSTDPIDADNLYLTTRKILARGATSGAAMLLGFIAAFDLLYEVRPCLS
jgi:hypothetical protein